MSLAARSNLLAARQSRTPATKAIGQIELNEEADCFENLVAHFDVAEFGGMGELQFFPEPVQNGRVRSVRLSSRWSSSAAVVAC